MDTAVITHYSGATKTLTARWTVKNFDQLNEQEYESDAFSSNFNPTISWKLSLVAKYKTDSEVLVRLVQDNHDDIVNGKAACRLAATVGKTWVIERRSIANLESNIMFSVHLRHTAAIERFEQILKELNEVKIIAVITYMDAVDKLETTYDDANNRLKVKWTIEDYPLTRPPLQYYQSKSFASIKFPNAKWVLVIYNANALELFKSEADNLVKAIVTAKVGSDTISTSLVAHDFYIKPFYSGPCPVNDLVTRVDNNVLVFEVTIEYQIIENAGAKISYKLFRQNADLLESGAFSDFSLIVGNEKIPVQKCILVPRWPFFKTAIETGLIETISNTMPINGFDVGTVRALLDYLYTNSTKVTTVRSALALMEAAHCYDLPELLDLCEQFVCKYINPKDVLNVLMKCQILSAKQGVKTCIEFIKKEAKSLKEYPDFDEFKNFDHGLEKSFADVLVDKE